MANTIEIVTKLRDQLTGKLRQQTAALSGWQQKAVLAGIAATGAAIAVARLTQRFIQFADQLTEPIARVQDIATGLQVSASEFAGVQFVIEQAGGSADALTPSLQRMRVAIAEAGNAGSASGRALDTLGISQARLLGMNAADQYITITGALSRYAGTAQQAEMAQALLGRGAVSLGGALNLSEAQMRQGIAAAQEMGQVMGDDAYAAADAFQDRLNAVKQQFVALQMEGIQPTLPQINDLLESGLELAHTVLPGIINSAGDLVGVLGDVVEAMNWVSDTMNNWGIEGGADAIERFRREMTGWEVILGPLGWGISGVRQAIGDTGDTAVEAEPGLQVYTDAMNALRDAANQAEAELASVQEQLADVEAARQYKKEEGYQDIVASREPAGGGGGVPGAPSDDDFKDSKDAYMAYLSEVEEMQSAAADRVEQHQLAAIDRAKQANIEAIEAAAAAEEEAAQRRVAAINNTMRAGEQLGTVIGDVMAQGARDQITFSQGLEAVGSSMMEMIANAAAQAVMAYAAEAAAAAAASQAGIPVIGPFLAAAAMGSMLALVQGLLGSIPHAAAGWTVPGSHRNDRVPALLEPGERVLTRGEARDFSGGGSRAGTVVNLTLGSMFSNASRSELQKAARTLRDVMDAGGM